MFNKDSMHRKYRDIQHTAEEGKKGGGLVHTGVMLIAVWAHVCVTQNVYPNVRLLSCMTQQQLRLYRKT